jgi:hypothetical protein
MANPPPQSPASRDFSQCLQGEYHLHPIEAAARGRLHREHAEEVVLIRSTLTREVEFLRAQVLELRRRLAGAGVRLNPGPVCVAPTFRQRPASGAQTRSLDLLIFLEAEDKSVQTD